MQYPEFVAFLSLEKDINFIHMNYDSKFINGCTVGKG